MVIRTVSFSQISQNGCLVSLRLKCSCGSMPAGSIGYSSYGARFCASSMAMNLGFRGMARLPVFSVAVLREHRARLAHDRCLLGILLPAPAVQRERLVDVAAFGAGPRPLARVVGAGRFRAAQDGFQVADRAHLLLLLAALGRRRLEVRAVDVGRALLA